MPKVMGKRDQFRKGAYVGCRFNLGPGKSNGDLIVARVISVRTNGSVELENLLNNKRSHKEYDILARRNAVIRKADAEKIVAAANDTTRSRGSALHNARELSIAACARLSVPTPSPPAPPTTDYNALALCAFHKLTDAGKQDFARSVWPEILAIFGID